MLVFISLMVDLEVIHRAMAIMGKINRLHTILIRGEYPLAFQLRLAGLLNIPKYLNY